MTTNSLAVALRACVDGLHPHELPNDHRAVIPDAVDASFRESEGHAHRATGNPDHGRRSRRGLSACRARGKDCTTG